MISRIFILTSTQFEGDVILEFNEQDRIARFDMTAAKLSVQQQDYILNGLPKEASEIERLILHSKTARLTEINRDITFEMFWDKYNEKVRSSRKRAQTKWIKMKKSEQIKAYNFISKYESNILPGTEKKYAETYLNAELWNN